MKGRDERWQYRRNFRIGQLLWHVTGGAGLQQGTMDAKMDVLAVEPVWRNVNLALFP